jgi:hypothetical protein
MCGPVELIPYHGVFLERWIIIEQAKGFPIAEPEDLSLSSQSPVAVPYSASL